MLGKYMFTSIFQIFLLKIKYLRLSSLVIALGLCVCCDEFAKPLARVVVDTFSPNSKYTIHNYTYRTTCVYVLMNLQDNLHTRFESEPDFYFLYISN
jgi:hypothetical protein